MKRLAFFPFYGTRTRTTLPRLLCRMEVHGLTRRLLLKCALYDNIFNVVQPISRVTAERKLVENVEKARAGFEEAIDDFLLTMTSLSRNGPNPEATRRLEIVTLRKDVTLQQLRLAVDRLNGFVLYGVVPEDLEIPQG